MDLQTSNIHLEQSSRRMLLESIFECTRALTEVEPMKLNVKDGQLSQWVCGHLWTQIGLCSYIWICVPPRQLLFKQPWSNQYFSKDRFLISSIWKAEMIPTL